MQNKKNTTFLALLRLFFALESGPQSKIFPGGTKVDAGPPYLFGHQSCVKFFILIFCQKLGEKKRSSLKFSPIFCQKLGADLTKKIKRSSRSSLKFIPIF